MTKNFNLVKGMLNEGYPSSDHAIREMGGSVYIEYGRLIFDTDIPAFTCAGLRLYKLC